jgi:regulator of sigma E protease
MIVSLLYVLVALFGLSVLIFFHELGHYYMARRVGMRVETFSIGFGKPLVSWERKGVKWQIGWLPFGGYVKIAGQEVDETKDPYEIPDGFFGKPPLDRIKVAFMGPFVNVLLAFLFFTAIWAIGGREKNFSEFTHIIGWVDPQSELYVQGIRPGDEISFYGTQPFQNAKDHLYAPMTSKGKVTVKGYKVDYTTEQKQPFELTVKTYPHPGALEKGIVTSGIISPANYILYNRPAPGKENPLPEGSPLKQSGLLYGDRILWVDGELIFSGQQMNQLLNDGRVLLTIDRGGERFLARVPKIQVREFKMDAEYREELIDWQYEAKLNSARFNQLYAIPYRLTNDCVVEEPIKFIDKENGVQAFPEHLYSSLEAPLQPHDKILAVDGTPVKTSYELLKQLQTHKVNIIVERDQKPAAYLSWKEADAQFDREIDWKEMEKIIQTIGTGSELHSAGPYVLLQPIVPKTWKEFQISQDKLALFHAELLEQKKQIEAIEDPEKKAQAYALLQKHDKQLVLGLPSPQDRKVNYDPNPIAQFRNVFSEIWRTLTAIVTGSLSPKWLTGPVGIVQVVHDTSMVSLKEALFWLGVISLNLAVLNLLPIPVLDGGTILLCLFEMVTRKRIKPKTLEKIVLPFAVLLIAFFIFLTYQDLSRLFSGFWH